MTPNSAYKIVPIVRGHDYCPKPAKGDAFASSDPVVYALLCVGNTCTDPAATVSIQTVGGAIDGEAEVRIPAAAFKVGVVYSIYLARLMDDCNGAVSFIGYQYKVCPLTF